MSRAPRPRSLPKSAPPPPPAVEAEGLTFAYGDRPALRGVSFSVPRGEVFALLGPNGGGKTTLFRILSTLLPPGGGSVRILGLDVQGAVREVRRRLGVAFQSPSVDLKLTVEENLRCHGALYGLPSSRIRSRIPALLAEVRLSDRSADRAETLSGGLLRRLEVAQALLHDPEVLLLDEPTAGLDPAARRDLWDALRGIRRRLGSTILLTSHLAEEAARCDRVGILNEGRIVALGTPARLLSLVGGEVLVVEAQDLDAVRRVVRRRFAAEARTVDGTLRLEVPRAHEFVPKLVEALPGVLTSVAVRKPSLEDVFFHQTGRSFAEEEGRR